MKMNDKYASLRLKNQLCFPLYAMSNLITRKYKPLLDKLDLTYTQYIVMMVLWEEKQVNEKLLCETLCLRSNTVAPLLKKLTGKGYIKKAKDKGDERNLVITLTEKGEKLQDKVATGDHHYSMVDAYAMPMAEKMNKLTDAATLHHIFGVAAFNLNSGDEQGVVVDSVLYQDKGFNITGQVSMKLHKVATDDSQGENHNLNRVWEAYEGLTPAYIQNTLAPELEWLGYDPDYTTVGDHIMMDCVYEHEDGTVGGVELKPAPDATNFNFMLRPLALSQGFTLTIYLHDGRVAVLDETNFEYGLNACDYTWASKPGKRKTYVKSFGIFEN